MRGRSVAGSPEFAARLFAATEALLNAVGVALSPVGRADWDRNVAAVRTVLLEDAGAAAWEEGGSMASTADAGAWDRIAAEALSQE